MVGFAIGSALYLIGMAVPLVGAAKYDAGCSGIGAESLEVVDLSPGAELVSEIHIRHNLKVGFIMLEL